MLVPGIVALTIGGMAPFMSRRSKEGVELYAQYAAVKNFLKDFSRLNEAPPASVVLWNRFLILAVVLILFGAKKLPELAKGLGTGIKEFKKATREVTDEIQTSMDDNSQVNRTRSLPSSQPEQPPQTVSQPNPNGPKG